MEAQANTEFHVKKKRAHYETEDDSVLTLLTKEQDRHLRAQAWRHIRRISTSIARKIKKNHG